MPQDPRMDPNYWNNQTGKQNPGWMGTQGGNASGNWADPPPRSLTTTHKVDFVDANKDGKDDRTGKPMTNMAAGPGFQVPQTGGQMDINQNQRTSRFRPNSGAYGRPQALMETTPNQDVPEAYPNQQSQPNMAWSPSTRLSQQFLRAANVYGMKGDFEKKALLVQAAREMNGMVLQNRSGNNAIINQALALVGGSDAAMMQMEDGGVVTPRSSFQEALDESRPVESRKGRTVQAMQKPDFKEVNEKKPGAKPKKGKSTTGKRATSKGFPAGGY